MNGFAGDTSRAADAARATGADAVLMAVLDRRGRTLDVNDALCRLTGWPRETLVGRSLRRLRSEAHSTDFWRAIATAVAAGRAWRGEVCLQARDGAAHWVEADVVPDGDGAGRATRYVLVARRLDAIAHAGSEDDTAEASLARQAESVAQALKAAGAVVLEFVPAANRLHAPAAVVHGHRHPEFAIDVAGSPFESLLLGPSTSAECSGREVETLAAETLFPGAPERLLSVCLVGATGERLGVLTALDPARDAVTALRVLQLHAERSTAALVRRRSERDSRRLDSALDAAPAAVLLADERGGAVYANAAFARLTGYSPDEARRLDVLAALAEDMEDDARNDLWQTLSEGRTWRGAMGCRRRDGTTFPARFAATPLLDAGGESTGTLVLLSDTPDASESEAALRRQIDSLQRVHRELTLARDGAEAASRAKTEFLDGVSRDLRTSMTGVVGMLAMLLETPLDSEQQELAESMRTACDGLLAGIEEISDFTSLESGQLLVEPVPFDIVPLVEEVVDRYAAHANRSGIELVLQVAPRMPRRLVGDPTRVKQVLASLLDNAVRHTEHGHVMVAVDAPVVTESDALLCLTIEDTGVGMEPERLIRILNRLEPGRSTGAHRRNHFELGLPAVKRVTELMGGTLLATSHPGRGTTVNATLRMAHDPEAHERAARSPLHGVRALVVDDVEIHRLVLHRQMTALGMRVETAPDGATALLQLQTAAAGPDPFRLALIDNQMPGMTGEQLGRELRAGPNTSGLALMMFTATADRSEGRRFQQAGFDGFFVKPILPSTLQEALEAVLASRSTERAGRLVTQHSLAAQAAAAGPAAAVAPEAPARVLLVEDDTINQRVARRMLEKLGLTVDLACNGHAAVELWLRGHHDMIFMDCHMPEMDGFEASREIRRHEAGRDRRTPIIALTASVLPSDREKCRVSGMDDFLAKPIREDMFRAVFERNRERGRSEGLRSAA